MSTISPQRRQDVIDALRRGTVPERGLDLLAVGLDRFETAIDEELAKVQRGGANFKAIRGEYGSGKTFAVRWLAERARRQGFATAEVQISEGETPLHKLQTVYRRVCERLTTPDMAGGALRSVIDGWFFALEEDVLAGGEVQESDEAGLLAATEALAERRLAEVARQAPAFTTVLRAYRRAVADGDVAQAEGLLAWLGGQPHVAAAVKRAAGIKGDLDHGGALSFLSGLLTVLRDAGRSGLVLVLDEVETLQRVRGDVRERALNGLRQLIDEIDGGRFPGLYLVITGTPAFFDGPQGVKRLPPLAQRLHTDFTTDARFDNPRAVQIRLSGFSHDGLVEVGTRVRDIYADGPAAPDRVRQHVDDSFVATLANAVTGDLGGQVGIAPRVFLRKLVEDVLDRVDQFDDFDPRQHYTLTIGDAELTDLERNARAATSVDDIDLEL
ncbi:putative ATP/GTP binding protein [Euzebya pacifica]|uniref:Putative ATP/GTP binding protein n=1 Tax=Euzebya pacifica TaxID=1608957 RepID=A0A346XRX3_9ACTN|nr:BREX system ATP-binding protein BrxD [Euzebya pacifica]AXV04970.1 putative ATP/GTP binding protein [Euzebya pacifica]